MNGDRSKNLICLMAMMSVFALAILVDRFVAQASWRYVAPGATKDSQGGTEIEQELHQN